MLTVIMIVLLGAAVTAIASAMGRCPLWVSVMLLCVLELIVHFPVGK